MVFACVDMIGLICMLYIGYKVISLVKHGNKTIKLLVIFMNLTFLADFVQKLLIIEDSHVRIEHCESRGNVYGQTTSNQNDNWLVLTFFNELPCLMLLLTVSINLHSWAFYFIKIRQMAYDSGLKTGQNKTDYEFRVKLLNFITAMIIITIIFLELYWMYNDIKLKKELS